MDPKLDNYLTDFIDLDIRGNMILDQTPLLHFLKREFSWIINVTGIEIPTSIRNKHKTVQISIVVSPIHYCEISTNFSIENLVKKKLLEKIQRLLVAMYPEIDSNDNVRFLFFPVKSQTLLGELQ